MEESTLLSDNRGIFRQRGDRKSDYIVVSFYTENYRDIVKNLVCSLKKFDISYCVELRQSAGDWLMNVNQKPIFIKEKMLEFKKNIVWIDADAIVKKYPVYFDVIEEDIGIHYENLEGARTGVLFFKYNDIVLEFLDRWTDVCNAHNRLFDQKNIMGTIRGFCFETNKMTFFWLPKSYLQIFDIKNDGKAVIEHYQASRKFR